MGSGLLRQVCGWFLVLASVVRADAPPPVESSEAALAGHACKTLFYKFVGPVKLVAAAHHSVVNKTGWIGFRREVAEIFRKDKYHALGWAGINFLVRGFSIPLVDFDRATMGDPCKLPGPILVVNSFELDFDAAESDLSLRSKFNCRSDVTFLRASTWEGARAQIKSIVQKNGPFRTGILEDHGLPGQFGNSDMLMLSHELQTGWFKPGAKLIVRGCLTANGERGDQFHQRLGRAWLDQGGETVGTQVPINVQAVNTLGAQYGTRAPFWLQRLDAELLYPIYPLVGIQAFPWLLPLEQMPDSWDLARKFERPHGARSFPVANPIRTYQIAPRPKAE